MSLIQPVSCKTFRPLKYWCLGAMALFILLSLNACELFAGKGGGTETETMLDVTGRVYNLDRTPAVNARVTVRSKDYLTDLVASSGDAGRSRETTTDARGEYRLRNLPLGNYRLEVTRSDSSGSVQDFQVLVEGKGFELKPDTLYPPGGITGIFSPDSETQLASYVQVYGVERFVKADPAGAFVIGNLPPGLYDIRCSSLQPFRRDAIIKGVKVISGQITPLQTITLEREAKLSYSIDSLRLMIDGMDPTNPVILDNELWDNGIEIEYTLVKASTGELNLRGNIATQDIGGLQNTTIDAQIKIGMNTQRLGRLAGITNMVEIIPGANKRITLPLSGRIEDIVPVSSPGSDLIVLEARKATPEKPLIVVVGGPLTTVAEAYLTDPSIASRMVVAGIYSFGVNSADSVSTYIVAKKCRFLHWGRNFNWDNISKLDTNFLSQIPTSRMGEKVLATLRAAKLGMYFGDLAPLEYLFDKKVWKTANMVRVSDKLVVQPASDITFDFLDIPLSANDGIEFQKEFFSALANTKAYKAYSLPGAFRAEAFSSNIGTSFYNLDSTANVEWTRFPLGAWANYQIENAAQQTLECNVKYRSALGGKLTLTINGQATMVEMVLPPASSPTDIKIGSILFPAGISTLRISAVEGSVNLDQIDFK